MAPALSLLLKDSERRAGLLQVPREPQAWAGTKDSLLHTVGLAGPLPLKTETSITCLDKLNDNRLESIFLKQLKGQCLRF